MITFEEDEFKLMSLSDINVALSLINSTIERFAGTNDEKIFYLEAQTKLYAEAHRRIKKVFPQLYPKLNAVNR